jgi:hypothetical protein
VSDLPDAEPYDSRFTLPDVDAPAATEIGVILQGLDPERLLAGLGFARLADDPALVAEVVDHARHGEFTVGLPELAASGLAHWLSVRPRVDASPAPPTVGALRQEWANAARHVGAALPEAGPSVLSYLTACWIRRDELDRFADEEGTFDVVPEIPAE